MIVSGLEKIKEISEDKFDEIVMKNEGLVIVDFYATWCGPCKMLAPVIEALAEKYTNVSFIRINIDENENLVQQYNIEGVPTLIYFKDGKKIREDIGYMSQQELEEIISSLL